MPQALLQAERQDIHNFKRCHPKGDGIERFDP
jgi:hypothetical protein